MFVMLLCYDCSTVVIVSMAGLIGVTVWVWVANRLVLVSW